MECGGDCTGGGSPALAVAIVDPAGAELRLGLPLGRSINFASQRMVIQRWGTGFRGMWNGRAEAREGSGLVEASSATS